MVVYPTKLTKTLERRQNVSRAIHANAAATSANFSCGTFVRFLLSIDVNLRLIVDASFSSNGCGFMLAAAGVLVDEVTGEDLRELHGLAEVHLNASIGEAIGDIPLERAECVASAIAALQNAFADFRARQIEEFHGEKALICTCFGVSEDTIEQAIVNQSLTSVEQVTAICSAGGGCGSCRMLIQEILDSKHV